MRECERGGKIFVFRVGVEGERKKKSQSVLVVRSALGSAAKNEGREEELSASFPLKKTGQKTAHGPSYRVKQLGRFFERRVRRGRLEGRALEGGGGGERERRNEREMLVSEKDAWAAETHLKNRCVALHLVPSLSEHISTPQGLLSP